MELETAKKIESKILEDWANKNSNEKLARAYNASGREYFSQHKYSIASYLLNKSIDLSNKNNFNNSEAYSLLIQMEIFNHNYAHGIKLLEKFEGHIQAQRKTPYKEEQELFDYLYIKLSQKPCDSLFSKDKCQSLMQKKWEIK